VSRPLIAADVRVRARVAKTGAGQRRRKKKSDFKTKSIRRAGSVFDETPVWDKGKFLTS